MFTTKNLLSIAGKHIFIALLFVLVAFGSVFFLSTQISKISTQAAKDRNFIATLNERTARQTALKQEIEMIGTNDTAIRDAFPPSNNILELITALESIALRNGIKQAPLHFSSPAPLSTVGTFTSETIRYENTLSVNIGTFIKYLKDFEKLPYFTKINALSISSGSDGWHTGATVSFSASIATEASQ